METPEIPLNRDLTYLGVTTYRDKNTLFGIKRKDRRQHVYILGKSGTGKSVLMFNMIFQNIQNGEGVCVVDPHGELVEGVLSAIPPHRMKDVVYFNPADAEHHIGFNVLELIDPQYKHLVASGLMGIFTKIWANAWSARMEYILNNCILALLDTPGTTLLGIPRMLVDKDYRQKIISNLKDPVIKAFWVHEYEAWQDKFRNEAIAPIQNKVGQFLSTSIIRNVVGQGKSTINIFDIMNEGKIFLVNVSKGRIGEDNSGLLGGMIITKIQLAAMERVRIPEETRKDFYLYVDEFQNFVTDAFAGILSEARKYRLNLTVAHQYTAQLVVDKSSAVRDAVFGNVGTMIVFRVGADDADFLEKEFDPEFTPQDIVSLPNYKIYLKLMIDGVTSRPFSAKTLPQMVKGGDKEVEEEVIQTSRRLYCRPKADVEREINDWSGMSLGDYNGPNTSTLEKFPAICSLCKKETTVPFKPEPGRPVYCKECVAKLKSGEAKPVTGSTNQVKIDDTKFFKPLADLGIEFTVRNTTNGVASGEQKAPAGASSGVPIQRPVQSGNNNPRPPIQNKPPVIPPKVVKNNSALRDILNKNLFTSVGNIPPKAVATPTAPTPSPISLDALKSKPVVTPVGSRRDDPRDRSASSESLNKLKEVISAKSSDFGSPVVSSEAFKEEAPTSSAPASTPQPIPQKAQPHAIPQQDKAVAEPPLSKDNIKEVPEDVLLKILEE